MFTGLCGKHWELEMRDQRAVETQSGSWMKRVLNACPTGAACLPLFNPHSMEGIQPLVSPGTERDRDSESEGDKTVDTRKPC